MIQLRIVGFLLALTVAIAAWMLTCAAWQFDEVAAGVLPLEPRRFQRLTVLTLGTGGAYEDHNRRGPATGIAQREEIVLVDAGRGVAQSLRAAKIPASQPGTVLLTSLLPENTAGLADLLATGWLAGRRTPVQLLGPPGTAALARGVEMTVRPGLEARARALGLEAGEVGFQVEEIGEGWSAEFGELSASAGALAGGPLPALAYRFRRGGRDVVVSGTGFDDDALVRFARGTHTLVHEAAFVPTPVQALELGIAEDPERLRREAAIHTSLDAVGRVAMRVGAKILVLVRLRPPPVYDLQITSIVDDHFEGRILIACDGDEITP